MKIAVVNTKRSNHTICTLTGQRIIIKPRDFVILTLEEERDISFWTGLKQQNVEKYGIKIVVDEAEIYKLECGKGISTFDSSIVDGFVSPVARDIASITSKKSTDKTITNNTKLDNSDTSNSDTVDDIVADNTISENSSPEYTEEMLSQMDKEDLMNLCDNFNIKYKKNNSAKTLVKLLLEAGV